MVSQLAEQVEDALERRNQIRSCKIHNLPPTSRLRFKRLNIFSFFSIVSQEIKNKYQGNKEFLKIFRIGPDMRNINLSSEITQNGLEGQFIADLWMSHFPHVILDECD